MGGGTKSGLDWPLQRPGDAEMILRHSPATPQPFWGPRREGPGQRTRHLWGLMAGDYQRSRVPLCPKDGRGTEAHGLEAEARSGGDSRVRRASSKQLGRPTRGFRGSGAHRVCRLVMPVTPLPDFWRQAVGMLPVKAFPPRFRVCNHSAALECQRPFLVHSSPRQDVQPTSCRRVC